MYRDFKFPSFDDYCDCVSCCCPSVSVSLLFIFSNLFCVTCFHFEPVSNTNGTNPKKLDLNKDNLS